MDLKVEAQRVMAVALGKMYNSRLQRGGIRLHKSLLLSLVLRSARDIYLNVRAEQQELEAGQGDKLEAGAEAMEVEEDGERGAGQGEECVQPRDCVQSDSGRVQPRDCVQSDSGRVQPRDCIQSDSGRVQPRDCVQSDSGRVQPRDCIQSDSGRVQPRDCVHCDRDKVSDCPQLSVPEPGARDPGVRSREAARRPGLTRDRKRRKGSDQRDPPDPECLPSKRARLDGEEEPRSLDRVRGLGKAAADSPREQPLSPGHVCRHRALEPVGMMN